MNRTALLPTADAIEAHFRENFTIRAEIGASVCVWRDGQEVLCLSQGHMNRERTKVWTDDTLVPVWSATKGPASVATLMALHEANLALNTPVVEVWPEFFLHGKDGITFEQVMCHTAGLCVLDERTPIFDYGAVIHSIERQRPIFTPGTTQAYCPRTYGFVVDEIVRRITGAESLGQYFDEIFGQPMNLDFWIGLPHEHHHRVATLFPGKYGISPGDVAFQKAFSTQGSVTQRAFSSPQGLNAVQDMNQPHAWQQGYVSMGGVGSARGLAKFYGMLANGGKWQGVQIIPHWIMGALSTAASAAVDEVLRVPLAFSAGMMMDPIDGESLQKMSLLCGPNAAAFGHAGAGGSLAFADPDSGYAFAYVMNQMEVGVLPGPKALGLVKALYGL
jgi:CubicO group peptidase (beta-lactamase class C family)